MKRLIYLVITCYIFLFSFGALATPARSLYSAEVVVKDRSQKAWHRGIRIALSRVLVKTTGKQDIFTQPEIQSIYDGVDTLVQRYSYRRKQMGAGQKQLILKVSFDAEEIKQVLQHTNQPMWRGKRPSTLLWLALQTTDNYIQVMAEDHKQQHVNLLHAAARRRGIDMILPKMDLTDITSISTRDIWNFNSSLLAEVGQRYHADGFIMAKVNFADDQLWHAQCAWIFNDNKVEWSAQQTSLDFLIDDIVDHLANEMAALAARTQANVHASNIMIRVKGVNGIDEYTNVMRYLKTLTPVKNVQLESMEPNAVILLVKFNGELSNLEQAIAGAQDHHLVAMNPHDYDDQQSAGLAPNKIELEYQWQETQHQT